MRICLFLSLCFFLLPCYAKDVYRSVSEDGVVRYSDTYSPGSERISVSSKAIDSGSIPYKTTTSRAESGKDENVTSVYQTFTIAKPEPEETINSNEGIVMVALSLLPTLIEGHVIQIYLDGTKLDTDLTTNHFVLNALDRGTHSLQAKIVDADGNSLSSTEMINFHLHKASINKP